MKKLISIVFCVFFSVFQLYAGDDVKDILQDWEQVTNCSIGHEKQYELVIYEKSGKTGRLAKDLFNEALYNLLEFYNCESIVISDWYVMLFPKDITITTRIEDRKIVQILVVRKNKKE